MADQGGALQNQFYLISDKFVLLSLGRWKIAKTNPFFFCVIFFAYNNKIFIYIYLYFHIISLT